MLHAALLSTPKTVLKTNIKTSFLPSNSCSPRSERREQRHVLSPTWWQFLVIRVCLLCHCYCCLKSTWYPRREEDFSPNRLSFMTSISHRNTQGRCRELAYNLMHYIQLKMFFFLAQHSHYSQHHFKSHLLNTIFLHYFLVTISNCPTSIMDVTTFFAYSTAIFYLYFYSQDTSRRDFWTVEFKSEKL